MANLTKEQQQLVDEIMRESDRQTKVDDIVRKTKKALEIYRNESQQAKVDKIVERELKKIKS